jgi:DHA1 family tetracycline resistance protein-like MFS transporter
MAWAPTLGWLFLGRVISGLMGSNIATASAYIADISTPKTRAQNFGIIGAAFGLGFIIGPLLGGVLGAYGTRIPFLISAGLVFVNWIYGYFILPESLPEENRRPFEWKRAKPTATLENLKKYPVILGMVASLVLLYVSSHAVQSNWVYYTQEKFDWDIKLVGYSLAFVGVVFVIIQGGLIRLIIPALGQERTVYVGLFLSACGFILYSLAANTMMMFLFTIVYCFGSIAGPALQGIISTQVPPNEQGELMGGLSSLQAVTNIIGPLVMMGLFRIFTADFAPFYFPEISMILGALLTLIAAILARRTLKQNIVMTKVGKEKIPS